MTLTFSLVVNDGSVDSSADTVTITVNNINTAPVADASTDQSVNELVSVTLNGAGSTDAENDTLTYAWTQTSGPNVTLSSATAANPTFTAPTLTSNTLVTLTFSLIVNDGNLDSQADTVDITVNNVNTAPVADASADQTVNEAVSVTLNGSGSSDAENDALTYTWTQTSGPSVTLSSATAVSPTFTAPTLNNNTPVTLTFSLTVNDDSVDSPADTVTITVNNINTAPVADAGENQLNVPGDTQVVLSGQRSTDADGDALTYSWLQLSGPQVTLSNRLAVQPTFSSPTATTNYDLIFSLTVNDGMIDSSAATVKVGVLENTAPTVLIENVPEIVSGAFTVNFEFSEDVTGFELSDIVVSNADSSEFSGSGKSYTALIAPKVDGIVTIDVPAAVAKDAAENDNIAAVQAVSRLDDTSPSVTISGVSDTVRGPFDLTVTFTEAVTGFTASDVNVTNGTASSLSDLGGGTFSVSIAPGSHGAVEMQVIAGSATDGAGNSSEASNILRTDYIDETFVKTRTQGIIHNFMARRADQITLNDPDLALRFIQNKTDAQLSGQGDSKDIQLAFNASASGEDAKLAQFIGANAASRVNLWAQTSFTRANTDTSKSNLGLAYAGIDYRFSEDTMIGLMGQYDWSDEEDGAQNYSVSGTGWMLGPYVVSRLGEQLIFDGRVAWGQSENEVSPFRTYTDKFSADRWLLKSQLTGDFALSDWRINPSIALLYFEETSEAYEDSLGVSIDEQAIKIGRLTFGPRVSKAFNINETTTITPNLLLRGVWDFESAGLMDLNSGFVTEDNQLRARFEGGFGASFANGITLKLDGFYDGIGTEQFEAYGFAMGIKLVFD